MNKSYAGLALLTDLDGTLLTPEKTVSPEDAAAIADFRAKGGLFSIATGRGAQATQDYLDLLQPDFPAVMYNGALLYDSKTGRPAAARFLPPEAHTILTELAAAFPDAGAEVLTPEGVFVFQDSAYEREHLKITRIQLVMRPLSEIRTEECYKALFACAPERITEMQQYIADAGFPNVSFTRSYTRFLEILPAGTNKGTALQTLRGMLPAGTRIGATGDFDNDSAMLLAADYSGCPADSQPAVLEAVRSRGGYISGKTCQNGFFAEWITAFLRKMQA